MTLRHAPGRITFYSSRALFVATFRGSTSSEKWTIPFAKAWREDQQFDRNEGYLGARETNAFVHELSKSGATSSRSCETRGSAAVLSLPQTLPFASALVFRQQRTPIGRARTRPDWRSLARQTFRLRFGPGSRSNALTRTSAVRSVLGGDVVLRWALDPHVVGEIAERRDRMLP